MTPVPGAGLSGIDTGDLPPSDVSDTLGAMAAPGTPFEALHQFDGVQRQTPGYGYGAPMGAQAQGYGTFGEVQNPHNQIYHPSPVADFGQIIDPHVEDMRDAGDALGLVKETMDPEFRYRWVQVRGENVTRKLLRGYQFVVRSEDEVRPLYDVGEGAAEDRVRRGDTVLMKVRVNRLMRNRKYNEDYGRMRIKHNAQRFKDRAASARTASGEPVRVFEADHLRGEPGT